MKLALVACVIALAACKGAEQPTAPAAAPVAPTAGSAGAKTGRVETARFHSDALGVDKAVVVYLPAGYDASADRRYRVFYYLHGLGGQETDWTSGMHLDAAADALGLDAIVVMPDGDDSFYVDSPAPIDFDACMKDGTGLFFPDRPRHGTCVHKNDYETYVTKDLIGWVDRTYRTIATRDARAIAGLSMGGYGALMLAMRHPDLFSAAASHSGVDALDYVGPHPYVDAQHVQLLDQAALQAPPADMLLAWVGSRFGRELAFWRDHDPAMLAAKLEVGPGPRQLALYLDCGTEDDFHLDDEARYLHDVLGARGIAHAFFLGPGRHDGAFWRARVPMSLAFLREHTRG